MWQTLDSSELHFGGVEGLLILPKKSAHFIPIKKIPKQRFRSNVRGISDVAGGTISAKPPPSHMGGAEGILEVGATRYTAVRRCAFFLFPGWANFFNKSRAN